MRALNISPNVKKSFVLYVTKGLIDIAEAELREIVPGAVVREREERFLIAAMTLDEAARLGAQARVLDDVRLLVGVLAPVRNEQELEDLCAAAAKEIESSIPDAVNLSPWSVTLSARNPPWRRKPKWNPKAVLSRALHGADPDSTSRRPVDVRIQLDDQRAHLAVNCWDQPVGKRSREMTESWPGALRPTVAAALVRLAIDRGDKSTVASLYDPFCGSGTIAGEAALRGIPVFASDQSENAVELTRQRLAGMGLDADELTHRVFVRDVHSGPDQRVTANLVVANLPWGKQVNVDSRLALFDATALLTAHALRAGGAAVFLTTHEEPLISRLRKRGLAVESRRIGLLGQTPAIVMCTRKS